MKDSFILKGAVYHTPAPGRAEWYSSAYIVCENGICRGVFDVIPDEYAGFPVEDHGRNIIFPGMIDLHIHASQFAFRGTGMDYELLDWLKVRTFPEEEKFRDPEYAVLAYKQFAEEMKESATTRMSVFATVHKEATVILMDIMESTGLISYIGKVNMDRNAPPELLEQGAEASARDTVEWLEEVKRKEYKRTMPVITPRFIPSCSDELMDMLGQIRQKYGLPVQSHLSENPGEVDLVRKLRPDAEFYGDAYDKHGLFGGDAKTVMAHCVWSTEEEVERIKENGVWVAHCPASNMNLGSGTAPVRRYLEKGLKIGLGTDVAAGESESVFNAITDAIKISKLHMRYSPGNDLPLSFAEAFYLATKGGGSFFGRTGSFEDGYEFDAVVLDDSTVPYPFFMTTAERMERAVYNSLDLVGIRAKYVAGEKIDITGSQGR